MGFDEAPFVFTESNKQDQANSLDADNSKDLKALVTHDDDDDDDKDTDDHETQATTAAPIPHYTAQRHPSSKRHSNIDMAVTKPSIGAVMPSTETVILGEDMVNNGNFSQVVSGDRNSNAQQSRLSSALKDITPQDEPSVPNQGEANNVKKVCVGTFLLSANCTSGNQFYLNQVKGLKIVDVLLQYMNRIHVCVIVSHYVEKVEECFVLAKFKSMLTL